MKTREEKILEQIALQNRMVLEVKVNLVNCGHCGSVMLHEIKSLDEEDSDIECPFCDMKSDPCDFPDFFYDGMELSEQI